MFTKAQRIELDRLSLELFGSCTQWRRIHKKRRIHVGGENVEVRRYMRLKSGQIITAATAIERGLIPAQLEVKSKDSTEPTFEPQPLTQSNASITYREATFDEMKVAMLTALETKQFSEMPPVQMILTAAVKYLRSDLLNMPYLVVGENGQKDFEDLLALVPEDKREVINKWKVPQGNPNLFCIDGVQFLSDVVFASAQPDKAAQMLAEYTNGGSEQDVQMDASQSIKGAQDGNDGAAQV